MLQVNIRGVVLQVRSLSFRYSPEFLVQIKNLIAPPKCKVKVSDCMLDINTHTAHACNCKSSEKICSPFCRQFQSKYVPNTCHSRDCQVRVNAYTQMCMYHTTYVHCIPMLRLTFVTSSYIHTAKDAKCWFVKLWSSLELFGMEFFSSTNVDTKDNGLVGVSKYRVRRRWCGGRCRQGRKQRGKGERRRGREL